MDASWHDMFKVLQQLDKFERTTQLVDLTLHKSTNHLQKIGFSHLTDIVVMNCRKASPDEHVGGARSKIFSVY